MAILSSLAAAAGGGVTAGTRLKCESSVTRKKRQMGVVHNARKQDADMR
jgi:hypothetical protein